MSQLRIVKVSGILLIIVGALIATGAIVAYPIGNSMIDNAKIMATDYLNQANATLFYSQEIVSSTQTTLDRASITVNSTLSALSNGAELTANVGNSLNSMGSSINGIGQTISAINFLGLSPFASVGDSIISFVNPIQSAANDIQSVSSNLNSIKQQTADLPTQLSIISSEIDSFKVSLNQIRYSIDQMTNQMPNYFSQARLVLILVIVGFVALSVVIILAGASTLSLRKAIITNNEGKFSLQHQEAQH